MRPNKIILRHLISQKQPFKVKGLKKNQKLVIESCDEGRKVQTSVMTLAFLVCF